LKLTVNPLRQCVRVERPVEDDHAFGEERRQLLVALGDSPVERRVLPFDPVRSLLDRGIELLNDDIKRVNERPPRN